MCVCVCDAIPRLIKGGEEEKSKVVFLAVETMLPFLHRYRLLQRLLKHFDILKFAEILQPLIITKLTTGILEMKMMVYQRRSLTLLCSMLVF